VLMSALQRPLRWRAMPVEFEAPFVSRGDKSGTNAAELQLWKAAGPTPDASKEKWYRDIGGGMG
jgi:ABC-type tungstate transport system permease subunit